jgi:hypothetical protein
MARADQRLLKLMAAGKGQSLVGLLRELIKGGEAVEKKAAAAQAAAKPRAPARRRKAVKPKAKR